MAEKMCKVVKNDKVWKQVGTGTNTVTGLSLGDYEEVFIIVNSPNWGMNWTRVVPTIMLSNTEQKLGYDGGYSPYGETFTYAGASLSTVTATGKVNNTSVTNLAITVYAK